MSLRKNCPECGQGYEAKKATSKYCSGTCRQRAFRDKRREQLEKQSRIHVDSIERDLAAYGFSPVQIARLRTLAYDHEDTVTLAIGRYDPTGQMLKAREADYAQMAGCIKWVVRERLRDSVPRWELAAALQESENAPAAALLVRTRGLVKVATRKGNWEDHQSEGQKARDEDGAAGATAPSCVTL